MTTTLDVVKCKKLESSAEETVARELVRLAREQGLSLTGPDGLLKQFTKIVLETALNEEMTEHLGHEKHQADPGRFASNVRNGTRPKTVLTEATGQVTIEVPRDRDGSGRHEIVTTQLLSLPDTDPRSRLPSGRCPRVLSAGLGLTSVPPSLKTQGRYRRTGRSA